jgi:hypothetical protein
MNKFVATIVLCTILYSLANSQAIANVQQKPGLQVTINQNQVFDEQTPFIKQDMIYVPIRKFVAEIDSQAIWDAGRQKLVITSPEKTFKLSKPVIKKGRAFATLRSLCKMFGLSVTWDAQANQADVTYQSPYLRFEDGFHRYLIHPTSGRIYFAGQGQAVRWIGSTRILLKSDIEQGYVTKGMKRLNPTTVILNVSEMYGEPHLNDVFYDVVLRNEQIVLQTKNHYFGQHPIRNIDMTLEGDYIFLDGSLMYVLNNRGQIVKKHNLAVLTGYKDQVFQVEWYDRDYMIVRPHNTGWLTAIDLKTKKAVRIIDFVATKEQLNVYTSELANDPLSVDFRDWDGLTFLERNKNQLVLSHQWFLDTSEINNVSLDLNKLFR